jgi:hypothetical protein
MIIGYEQELAALQHKLKAFLVAAHGFMDNRPEVTTLPVLSLSPSFSLPYDLHQTVA